MADAFFAPAREGNFDALIVVLDPDVVLRADRGGVPANAPTEVRGALTMGKEAFTFARFAPFAQPVFVNGAAGVTVAPGGRIFSVMAFTVTAGKIIGIDVLADPARLRQLNLNEIPRH